MPDEGVVVTMIAHSLSMSRDKYLLTRTREQFLADSHALMKSQLMTVEVIASMFSGDGKSDDSPSLPDNYINPGEDLRNARPEANGNHWDKAGPEMSDPQAAEWARRASKSNKRYSWYKTAPNRRYNVVNLDTRDPKAFMSGVKKFGK